MFDKTLEQQEREAELEQKAEELQALARKLGVDLGFEDEEDDCDNAAEPAQGGPQA